MGEGQERGEKEEDTSYSTVLGALVVLVAIALTVIVVWKLRSRYAPVS